MNRGHSGRTSPAMPKRFAFALALVALALAACNSKYNPYGTVTPIPSPTATTYSPNPNVTSAIVEVTVSSQPAAGALVSEATPDPNGNLSTAAPIAQATTGPNGQVTFSSLTPGQVYCWWYNFSPTVQSSNCTKYWQGNIVYLGN